MKSLEKENVRLKQLVADLSLDNSILRDVNSKNLLSPAKQRAAAQYAVEEHGVSERRACRILRMNRTTLRYRVFKRADEDETRARVVDLAAMYGRAGYRMITNILRNQGMLINHKA